MKIERNHIVNSLGDSINISKNYLNLYEDIMYQIDKPHIRTYIIEQEYKARNLGFTSNIGVSYNIYDNISIFGALGHTWAKLEFSKGKQKMNFSKIVTMNNNITIREDDKPKKLPSLEEDFNYNSWNFNIGLRYTFIKSN